MNSRKAATARCLWMWFVVLWISASQTTASCTAQSPPAASHAVASRPADILRVVGTPRPDHHSLPTVLRFLQNDKLLVLTSSQIGLWDANTLLPIDVVAVETATGSRKRMLAVHPDEYEFVLSTGKELARFALRDSHIIRRNRLSGFDSRQTTNITALNYDPKGKWLDVCADVVWRFRLVNGALRLVNNQTAMPKMAEPRGGDHIRMLGIQTHDFESLPPQPMRLIDPYGTQLFPQQFNGVDLISSATSFYEATQDPKFLYPQCFSNDSSTGVFRKQNGFAVFTRQGDAFIQKTTFIEPNAVRLRMSPRGGFVSAVTDQSSGTQLMVWPFTGSDLQPLKPILLSGGVDRVSWDFSPDESRLAVFDGDGLRVLDVGEALVETQASQHLDRSPPVLSMQWVNERQMLVHRVTRTPCLLDLESGVEQPLEAGKNVSSVHASSSGSTVAVTHLSRDSWSNPLLQCDFVTIPDGRVLSQLEPGNRILGMDADGHVAIVDASATDQVQLWDVRQGKTISSIDVGKDYRLFGELSADGSMLFLGFQSYDDLAQPLLVLRQYAIEDDRAELQHEWGSLSDDFSNPVSFLPASGTSPASGHLIAQTGLWDLHVWRLQDDQCIAEGTFRSATRVAAQSRNGRLLAMANVQRDHPQLTLLDRRTLAIHAVWRGIQYSNPLAFSPTGDRLAIGRRDGSIEIVRVPAAPLTGQAPWILWNPGSQTPPMRPLQQSRDHSPVHYLPPIENAEAREQQKLLDKQYHEWVRAFEKRMLASTMRVQHQIRSGNTPQRRVLGETLALAAKYPNTTAERDMLIWAITFSPPRAEHTMVAVNRLLERYAGDPELAGDVYSLCFKSSAPAAMARAIFRSNTNEQVQARCLRVIGRALRNESIRWNREEFPRPVVALYCRMIDEFGSLRYSDEQTFAEYARTECPQTRSHQRE